MCGIVGLLGRSGTTPDRRALDAMVRAVDHRGPDAWGTWTSGSVAFGHTRLSLVDPRPVADQPWVDGDDALVFNGEIYNHRHLARELEAAGDRLTTTSDTEVLFLALRRWGVAGAFGRLRGMFAFAFHDGTTRRTHLCRDRYGIKPLHYADGRGVVEFASEVKALTAIAPRSVDPVQALFSIRALGDKYRSRTMFRDIAQVPPGGHVVVEDGRIRSATVLTSPFDQVDPARYHDLDRAPFAAVVDDLRELLERAVATMSIADAPVGAFVSGGVDSSLLAALAHDRRDDFRGFTADVVGPSSELAAARSLSDRLGFELEVARFEHDDWLGRWAATTWALETPLITHPSAALFALVAERAHASGYKAVLTGEGADELFLGYPRLASGAIERVAAAPSRSFARCTAGRPPGRRLGPAWHRQHTRSSEFVRRRRCVRGGRRRRRGGRLLCVRRPEAGAADGRIAPLLSTSLQSLLQRNDRMGMAASIESRFPYLDEDVVAFAVNLPVRHKLERVRRIHDPKHPFVRDKAVVRELASRVAGDDIGSRAKQGFPTPGLRAVRVRPGAFATGWVAETFAIDRAAGREIDRWDHGYDTAKLASLEIFGRLFDANEAIADVDRWVRENVDLQG